MKKIIRVLAISTISVVFLACSKKAQTFQFGTPIHQDTPIVLTANFQDSVFCDEKDGVVVAIENPSILIAKQFSDKAKVETTLVKKKPTFKQRFAQKVIAKKIQKTEKGLQVSGNMKLGIIIAAVSLLVLIIVAAGLLGGLSGLFWLLGGLGLLAGLMIMLLDALDVI